MSQGITVFDIEPGLRFAATVKRGDVRQLVFTVEGYASLADDDWAAVARFRNGLHVVTLSCTAAFATVTAPNDSTRITTTWSQAQANAWRLGTYAVDIKSHTTDQTWASGTLTVVRQSVP